ncbi:MAG: hypothetical protein SFT81_03780 [Candidatus Caenarcaniphilales bacterium]|nr:hypothetical protein [Candidatus Caenarcaniphilales bacterium]
MFPIRPSRDSHYPEAVLRLEEAGCCNTTDQSQKSFKDALHDLKGAKQYVSPPTYGSGCECNDLEGIACSIDFSLEDAQATNQTSVENALQNILKASDPNHKRITPYRFPDGRFLIDESPNTLLKTNYQLDFGIEGGGKGFMLSDGSFTREGRFKYDAKGRLVSIKDEIPLEICYMEGAPKDWSLKKIRVDQKGLVTDRLDGRLLGRVKVDLDPKAKIRQGYQETSNVNLPLEYSELAAAMRINDMNAGILASKVKLDGESLKIVQGL